MGTPWRSRYDAMAERLQSQYTAIPAGSPVRLAKRTSNLFRSRSAPGQGLDVAAFDGVLDIDPHSRTAEVLGMTTYEHLVEATLPHGLMPLCVPQLRTITLGGAVTGMGIESASFRLGMPHESVLDMDVLTGAGDILTVSGRPDDPHRDLFHGFANSYGSLGYALRLRIELEPVQPYVLLTHVRADSADAVATMVASATATRELAGARVDFLDGTVFSPTEHYLTVGTLVSDAPDGLRPSDYTGMEIYYRSIRSKHTDLLTIADYLWRWDTDWFWCSRAFGAQNAAIRRLWPKSRLRSDVYWRLVALDRRHDLSGRAARLRGKPAREPVVQDIEVPVERLGEFLEFFHREVGISPIWLCPLRQRDPSVRWPLYEFDPEQLYVNVGFWSSVALPPHARAADGLVNRRIEDVVTELGGRKSLYSTSFYDRTSFWRIYGGAEYDRLKSIYDPDHRLPGLYEKVVQQT